MDDATALRRRAHLLDDAAEQLEGSPAITAHCRTDESVWRGGVAHRCRDELAHLAVVLGRVAAALRSEAQHCRHRADSLDAIPP